MLARGARNVDDATKEDVLAFCHFDTTWGPLMRNSPGWANGSRQGNGETREPSIPTPSRYPVNGPAAATGWRAWFLSMPDPLAGETLVPRHTTFVFVRTSRHRPHVGAVTVAGPARRRRQATTLRRTRLLGGSIDWDGTCGILVMLLDDLQALGVVRDARACDVISNEWKQRLMQPRGWMARRAHDG